MIHRPAMNKPRITYQDLPQSRWIQEVLGKDLGNDSIADQIVQEVVKRLPDDKESRTYSFADIQRIAWFAGNVGLRYEDSPAPTEFKVLFGAESVMGEAYYQGLHNPTPILEGEQ